MKALVTALAFAALVAPAHADVRDCEWLSMRYLALMERAVDDTTNPARIGRGMPSWQFKLLLSEADKANREWLACMKRETGTAKAKQD